MGAGFRPRDSLCSLCVPGLRPMIKAAGIGHSRWLRFFFTWVERVARHLPHSFVRPGIARIHLHQCSIILGTSPYTAAHARAQAHIHTHAHAHAHAHTHRHALFTCTCIHTRTTTSIALICTRAHALYIHVCGPKWTCAVDVDAARTTSKARTLHTRRSTLSDSRADNKSSLAEAPAWAHDDHRARPH